MANINISWTTIPADTSDIETYEVYVCDATANGHFTTAAQLQTKLDAIQGGATPKNSRITLTDDPQKREFNFSHIACQAAA